MIAWRRRTRIGVVAATCCLAAAACLFPAVDWLSGAGVADASADATADATGEASSFDAGAGPTWCADSGARFCEDFDVPGAPFAQWPSVTKQNGVSFTTAASDASAPFAVRFTQVAVGLDGGAPFGALARDFAPQAITKSAHLGFDMRIEAFPQLGDMKPLVTLQLDSSLLPDIDDCVALALQPDAGKLFECVPTEAGTSTYPSHPLSAVPAAGRWTHVDVDVLASPGDIVVTVAFDGATVLAPTKLDPRVVYAAPALQVGLVATDPRSSMSVVIDDLTLDWQ